MQFRRRAVDIRLWRLPCATLLASKLCCCLLPAFFHWFNIQDSRKLLFVCLDATWGRVRETQPSSRQLFENVALVALHPLPAVVVKRVWQGRGFRYSLSSVALSRAHTSRHVLSSYKLVVPPLMFSIHCNPPIISDSSPNVRGGFGELYAQSIRAYVYSLQGNQEGVMDALWRSADIFVQNPGICRFTAWWVHSRGLKSIFHRASIRSGSSSMCMNHSSYSCRHPSCHDGLSPTDPTFLDDSFP